MTTTYKTDPAGFKYIEKDPSAILDYQINWDDSADSWLGADTISGTPVWTVDSGLTKTSQSNTTTTATVWLSGGNPGITYNVSCKITTAGGRTDERSFRIKVVNR